MSAYWSHLQRVRCSIRNPSGAPRRNTSRSSRSRPISRAEIESIRGVQTSGGTLDVLMEAGWVKIAGRREVPGRPTIYATTPEFLDHFGLASRRDLPGIDELRATGLLDPVEDAYDALIGEGEVDGPSEAGQTGAQENEGSEA